MNSHKTCFITPGPHACSYHEEKKTRRGLVEVFKKTSNENKVAESDKSQRKGPILINVSIINDEVNVCAKLCHRFVCLKILLSTRTVAFAGWSQTDLPPCHHRTSLADLSSANTLLCILKVAAPGLIYTDCDQGCGALSFFSATACTPWLTSRWSEKERCSFLCPCSCLAIRKGCVVCAHIFIFTPHHSYRPDRKGCPPVMMR